MRQAHLERQASFDLISKPVRNRFVEVYENLHGQLGLDSALGDQVVERVCEGTAQTVHCQPLHSKPLPRRRMQYLLRRYNS
jgi:2-iminoacetate synthase ThiH